MFPKPEALNPSIGCATSFPTVEDSVSLSLSLFPSLFRSVSLIYGERHIYIYIYIERER